MALPVHPLGLKEGSKIDFLNSAPLYRFFLVLHHSGLLFLKALFLRGPPPAPRRFQARSYVGKVFYCLALTLLIMDFSRAGCVHSLPDAFRARVKWTDSGRLRECYGPRRPDEGAAKGDLESMRATASGKDREEGFAAMEAEAKRLRESKAKPQGGCVKESEGSYRAVFHWLDASAERDVKGPRRAEKRRAEEDRDALREASSNQADTAACSCTFCRNS